MALPTSEKGHPPVTRLKLIVPATDPGQRLSNSTSPHPQPSIDSKASSSPPRPSYSPVTPPADLAISNSTGSRQNDGKWMDEPPSMPVNMEDNSDAMALRAAISILQLQRQQALNDMRTLENIKQAGLEDPETFLQDLQQGNLSSQSRSRLDVDVDIDTDDDDGEPMDTAHGETTSTSKFARFPTPQNIVRCPPIEWGKYHVVGNALDKIHEHQQRFPGTAYNDGSVQQTRSHEIAAPYRPLSDALDSSQTTGAIRKKPAYVDD